MSAGQLWECADGANRETAVRGAVAAMRRGGLVILPTENSYVVAADAFSLRGTALLRRAKMVPESTPLGLLVASPVVVSGVAARVPRVAKKLMEAFWPGLLTVLLPPQPTLAWDHPKRAAASGAHAPSSVHPRRVVLDSDRLQRAQPPSPEETHRAPSRKHSKRSATTSPVRAMSEPSENGRGPPRKTQNCPAPSLTRDSPRCPLPEKEPSPPSGSRRCWAGSSGEPGIQ